MSVFWKAIAGKDNCFFSVVFCEYTHKGLTSASVGLFGMFQSSEKETKLGLPILHMLRPPKPQFHFSAG